MFIGVNDGIRTRILLIHSQGHLANYATFTPINTIVFNLSEGPIRRLIPRGWCHPIATGRQVPYQREGDFHHLLLL